MRTVPEYDSDKDELKRLKAKPWMLKALELNPGYPFWGPFEDYMGDGTDYNHETGEYKGKEKKGWAQNTFCKTWKDFGPWELDELNELVNFYFEINRKSKNCEHCDGKGVNPETKKISDDFYDFANNGTKWCDKITQDELDFLIEKKRIRPNKDGELPTVELVNKHNRERGYALAHEFGTTNHDAINRGYLIEARAKRLGVYGNCEHCDGHGSIYTEPSAKLSLVMWFIHPRKGCSKGVLVEELSKSDFKKAVEYLKEARQRNHDRFALDAR